MASTQAKIDAVKASIASTSTCTPAAVVALKDLLLPDPPEPQAPRPKSSTGRATTKTPTGSRAKSRTGAADGTAPPGELGARDRAALATHVINAALKSLTEVARPSPTPTAASEDHGDLRRAAAGKRAAQLRTDSAPLSPIQPRALNRVAATSPSVARTATTKPALPLTQTTGCLATIECARVAFACLRHIKGPVRPDQTDFQLENGISALAGKLIALGMYEQALKELRVLKRRLDGSEARDAPSGVKSMESGGGGGAAAAVMSDLLRFDTKITRESLPTITGFQMHLLKLVAATRKSSYVEAILPRLRDSEPASPPNLLLALAKSGEKEVVAKAARQLASMSQLLLSLAPSIASQEDVVAVEPRLSPSPAAAFEMQCLAFRTQLRWWKLAGHRGSVDDELLGPFARCARALMRRQRASDVSVYETIVAPFDELMALVREQKHRPSTAFTSPLVSIYQTLASVAQTERLHDEAHRWLLEVKALLVPGQDSSVRLCSVAARLLAAALKRTPLGDDIEELAREVADGLDGSLSGTVTELNELLESLSLARRSVVGMLMTLIGPNGGKGSSSSSSSSSSSTSTPGAPLEALLKTFLLRYPRFVRRWLGSFPGKDAGQKQVLQFDQRRQLVFQSVNQVLDATLMVIKCDIQSSAAGEWQPLDDVLQHCHSLLDTLSASSPLSAAKVEDLNAYRLKISSLYFSKFALLRKKPKRTREEEKQLLSSLNRSIDSVRDCTAADKEKSQLFVKLELFADLCKGSGRTEDAVRILRSVCTSMAEDGALSDVVEALASKPPALAWKVSDRAATMSRTLRSIARLDKAWNEWTFLLPEPERAAVLEHLMHLTSSGSINGTMSAAATRPLRLQDPSAAALLRVCSLERHPVRRLRILLRLLYQNIGEADQVGEITTLVDQALGRAQEDAAEDALLGQYIPHLQTYYSSMGAFVEADESFPAAAVAGAVGAWKSMVEKCETQDDLLERVDDPQGLLDHLRSLNQLAGLKGESLLQLSIVELSIAISRRDVGFADSTDHPVILQYSQLVANYVNIGLFPQALETLHKTQTLVTQREGKLSRKILVEFHISQAEYYTGIGDMATATACLDKANAICSDPYSSWAESKSQATLMLSTTSLLQSIVTLEIGDIQDALSSVKACVRMLSHDWSKLESAVKGSSIGSTSILSESDASSICTDPCGARVVGPRFWNLASPLLRGLLHMSSVYAHIGMFQETIYYADSAWKMAENLQSSLFKAQVSAWTGSVYLKASKIPKALGCFKLAEAQLPQGISAARVRFARQIGEFYGEIGEEERAAELFSIAEETARLLGRNGAQTSPVQQTPEGEEEEEEEEEEEAAEGVCTRRSRKAGAAARTTRSTRSTRSKTAAAAAQATKKRGANTAQTQTKAASTVEEMPKNIYQASLLAAIEISRSLAYIHQKDWASALASLEQVKSLPKLTGVLSQEQVMTAISLIGHSMEQMISDPVFSVMQDSTISFPAISASVDAGRSDPTSSAALPHQKKSGRGPLRDGGENGFTPPFADALRRAQELLMEAHSSALCSADSSMVRRISTLLQSTIIFLSATSAAKSRSAYHSGMGTVAVDIARNVTWTREQQTLTAGMDHPLPGTTRGTVAATQKPSIELTADMAKFQRRYIDVLPKKWSVISISLSDNRHDLCITKFQAGHSPFILRLPLERANSRDADSEIFNFENGREELLEIIRLANETSHSARDFSAKGERGAWWAERETLDNRLKELLVTIETTWLGGFKGIFSQHQRRSDLLARFQKSFQLMLDQNLPSRNNSRGKAGSTNAEPVVLDPRILDLFIGLGDPADPDYDFDEALNDLLYFVVDILQFHGERNAYDEIDFDAMVVQTYDALRGYHNEARAKRREDGAHTILVLEKALHAFPWESLPCMEGLAVSRVPSLAALRRLVADSTGMSGTPAGHHVSARSGTCILNPSSDLKNTQAFFQPAFSTLPSWTSIVDKRPQEADFEKALAGSDVVVYFGHGSGAQYIRGKTVRRLSKCRPATFLMGCSSAALTEAGEFECYGPVWNYMMAGCPAVVGTLWDVTDRDIDRFAGRSFEEWGLFAKGTFAARDRGKRRTKAHNRDGDNDDDDDDDDDAKDRGDGEGYEAGVKSLAEAVAQARIACRFRYLNAAAVVMYGIPVYISREQ